jgi:hypothetical protein
MSRLRAILGYIYNTARNIRSFETKRAGKGAASAALFDDYKPIGLTAPQDFLCGREKHVGMLPIRVGRQDDGDAFAGSFCESLPEGFACRIAGIGKHVPSAHRIHWIV